MDADATDHLDRAIALAVDNVAAGGGPFGAIVVIDGTAYEGVNRVTLDSDPTAHAEVVAIRRACAARGSFELAGAVLYSSCEPCPLCLSAAMWARIDEVVFAADRHQAAAAGFDDAAFYEAFEDGGRSPLRVRRSGTDGAAPFEAWLEHEARVDY